MKQNLLAIGLGIVVITVAAFLAYKSSKPFFEFMTFMSSISATESMVIQ